MRSIVIYVGLILGLSAAWPLAVAWRNTRGSTIRHALAWAWIAWAAWLWYGWSGGPIAAYAALTLTAAAGIAVFGARRPGVVAWHFVVIGLLAVLWLPWAEGLIRGSEFQLDGFRRVFLAALLCVALGNFWFTRTGFGTIMLGCACFLAMCHLFFPWLWYYPANVEPQNLHRLETVELFITMMGIGNSAWEAWSLLLAPRRGSATDQLWSRFRDTFGAVWALRLREQFNTAAQNAGWPVRLGWFGLVPKTENPAPEWHETMVALQKRFVEPGA